MVINVCETYFKQLQVRIDKFGLLKPVSEQDGQVGQDLNQNVGFSAPAIGHEYKESYYPTTYSEA